MTSNMYVAQNFNKTKYVISSIALANLPHQDQETMTKLSSLCKFVRENNILGIQYDPWVSRSGVYAVDFDRSLMVLVKDNTVMLILCIICECYVEQHIFQPDGLTLVNPELLMCHLDMTKHKHYQLPRLTGSCYLCQESESLLSSPPAYVWHKINDGIYTIYTKMSLLTTSVLSSKEISLFRRISLSRVCQAIQIHGILAAYHTCVSKYIICIIRAEKEESSSAILYCVPDPGFDSTYHWGVVCLLCRNIVTKYTSINCAREEHFDLLKYYLIRIAGMCKHITN